ncbi:cyclin-domain-containing protein [Coprinopsis marcescibilis]|uniref:Cyclin-domain-containing protein n=1 Tax=Coprinopsis marcescibilis TaxID=230819 RepID=A0A5C3L0A5_COPMA|nr:cyclin-domain-containing protein [Coprinopsis marcescibilis]
MASASSGKVELPANLEDVPVDSLLQLIADMLERLIVHNDRIPLSPEALTRFHSRTPPGISILNYLQRIVTFTSVEKSCLLLILVYIDRVCARWPLFTLSSLTAHRFIIAAITVSSKGLCDTFSPNKFYARVGGISVSELNTLEREFLSIIDWRLMSTRDILQEYYINLIRTHSSGNFIIIGTTSPSLSSDSDMDLDSSGQSAPPSPTDLRHRSQRSISEPSTILVEPGTSAHDVIQRPTLEQNMAFAALRESQEKR